MNPHFRATLGLLAVAIGLAACAAGGMRLMRDLLELGE
jgi:hypothetical protein